MAYFIAITLARQGCKGGPEREPGPILLSPGFFATLRPAVAKVYIVSFRTHDDSRPSKFIVVANDRKEAITMAWEAWRA